MYQKFVEYMAKYVDFDELKLSIIMLFIIVVAMVFTLTVEKYEKNLLSKYEKNKEIENNEKMLYNSVNESESGINGTTENEKQ